MGLDWGRTPFIGELPLPPAAYKKRVGGNGVQLEKRQNKIKKVEALGLQRHPQIRRSHTPAAFLYTSGFSLA